MSASVLAFQKVPIMGASGALALSIRGLKSKGASRNFYGEAPPVGGKSKKSQCPEIAHQRASGVCFGDAAP